MTFNSVLISLATFDFSMFLLKSSECKKSAIYFTDLNEHFTFFCSFESFEEDFINIYGPTSSKLSAVISRIFMVLRYEHVSEIKDGGQKNIFYHFQFIIKATSSFTAFTYEINFNFASTRSRETRANVERQPEILADVQKTLNIKNSYRNDHSFPLIVHCHEQKKLIKQVPNIFRRQNAESQWKTLFN